jgi:hypothetical protein
MKKLVIALLIAGAGITSAHADGYRHHGGYYRGGNSWGWVAPLAIGGVIGYELNRPRYYEPPVIVQQPMVIQQPIYSVTPAQNCTVWTETQHADGTITRTRTCTQ